MRKHFLSLPVSLRAVQNTRRGNLLTSSTLAASPLSLRRNVVTDAICLQAALVFGLLRYARNDKKQDGRVVLKTPRHDNLLLDRHTTLAMTTCF